MPKDVNDPSNLSGRAKRQVELLGNVEHDQDRAALQSWANEMLTGDVANTTIANRLSPARLCAERADRPLVEFDGLDDLTELLSAFADGSHPDVPQDGYSDGTIRQYRQATKLFFRHVGREWAEDIVIGSADPTPITEDQILSSEDVDALLDAAENPRDAALVAFLTVTGQRISAALSIRLGDLEFGERTASVRLNDDAEGLKNASGPRPLLWAQPFIQSWRSSHPRQGDPDAPLFCTTQSGQRPHEDGSIVSWSKGEVLSPSQVRSRLSDLALAAGVDPEKVKPHNFRHTAITRMRDNNVSDDRIKFMVGVAPDSDILERYDKQSDERMMRRLRESHGIDEDDEADVGAPSLDTCPHCRAPLRETARYCDSCGTPLNAAAAEEQETTVEALMDDLEEFGDREKRAIARESVSAADDPDLLDAVADRVIDRLDGH